MNDYAAIHRAGALSALTDIEGLARLLHRGVEHGPPLNVGELKAGGKSIVSAAKCLESAFLLWLRVSNKGMSASRQRALLGAVNAISLNADSLAQATGQPGILARTLLVLVESLRQKLITQPPVTRSPDDPASATTGETP